MHSLIMKITHFLYNTFLIAEGKLILAIDPGGLFLYYLRMTTLIPKSEWADITHIFVTHGDPDHYWHADRVASASGAPIIFNKTMVQEIDGQARMLGPRSRGLSFSKPVENFHTLGVGETITLDGMSVTGIKTTHGALVFKAGPFTKTVHPGPDERIGWGAIGFGINLGGRYVVNLGDTLLHKNAWKSVARPDVLMIPIGGKHIHNTMDEDEALQAVEVMQPKMVIPCHYNCPAFLTKKYNPADEQYFKREATKLGAECVILRNGESLEV